MSFVDLMNQYNTELSQEDELQYTMWIAQMKNQGKIHPDDMGQDYDFRGLFQELKKEGNFSKFSAESHFPDTYKKPNHETFSVDSKYATGANEVYAGRWIGEKYIATLLKYVPSSTVEAVVNEVGSIL